MPTITKTRKRSIRRLAKKTFAKTGGGFRPVRNVKNLFTEIMCSVIPIAYFRIAQTTIVYDKYLHRFEECPRVKGYKPDDSIHPMELRSVVPWKDCPDCERYYSELESEQRRRDIKTGEYRAGVGDELVHVECGRVRNHCSCFDI
jgi:hypothetical protein